MWNKELGSTTMDTISEHNFRDFIVGDRVKLIDKGDIGTINRFYYDQSVENIFYINEIRFDGIIISIFKELTNQDFGLTDQDFGLKVSPVQLEIANDFSDISSDDTVLLSNGKQYSISHIEDDTVYGKIFYLSNGLSFNTNGKYTHKKNGSFVFVVRLVRGS